jgi:hypothetical protein
MIQHGVKLIFTFEMEGLDGKTIIVDGITKRYLEIRHWRGSLTI